MVIENNESRQLLTVLEAARRLGIGRTSMYGLMRQGEVPYIKIRRSTRIDPSDLHTFIRDNRRNGR